MNQQSSSDVQLFSNQAQDVEVRTQEKGDIMWKI